jgi:hypothetical protein
MPNIRVLPPVQVASQTQTVNGRSYTGSPGSVLDVPDFDANVLTANNWTKVAVSGATSARPTNPARGMFFVDTTLAYVICWDGAAWRNPATGASV